MTTLEQRGFFSRMPVPKPPDGGGGAMMVIQKILFWDKLMDFQHPKDKPGNEESLSNRIGEWW